MVNDQLKETLATTDLTLQVASALVSSILHPEHTGYYRNPIVEHKVASSMRKQLAKHLTPVSE